MKQDYKPIPPNQPVMLNQGVQNENTCCFSCRSWFIQIIIWLMFFNIILSFSGVYDDSDSDSDIFVSFAIGSFIFFYIFYLVFELKFSPTAKYLRNKNTDEDVYQNLGKFFRTPPEIKISCQCFHVKINIGGSSDNIIVVPERKVTYSETIDFPYFSARDVSGLFHLNYDRANLDNKKYIKLQLEEEINFADTVTYMDYNNIKTNMTRVNRYKDLFFQIFDQRTIPGLTQCNLIKLGEDEPAYVKYKYFVLASILTLSEIYTIYFNRLCVNQKFKIRKLVSTRYDLNQPEFDQKYQALNPHINLISQTYNYHNEDYNYINNNFKVNLPSQEEVENAAQYQDKIPDYKISTGEGQLQPGVIIDNPEYTSYKKEQIEKNDNKAGDNKELTTINNSGDKMDENLIMVKDELQGNFH